MTQQIIIADDHPLFRSALKQAVKQAVGAVDIIEADSINSLQEALACDADVDLVMLDLNMPGAHGFSGLVYLRGQFPALPVVVVSGTEDANIIRKAIACGAAGFIPKSAALEDMTEAIRTVLRGEISVPPGISLDSLVNPPDSFSQRLGALTPQQFRVLGMLTEGLLNKQIAYELNVSEATVKRAIHLAPPPTTYSVFHFPRFSDTKRVQ
jgi:DNA-binding NarL/FixJ family response regulator